jgi:predicted RNA-binding protein (virulence factor B family)
MIFSHYEVGNKFNSVWLDNNNIHICPIRTIQQEGTKRRVVVRWEEDIMKEVWQCTDEKWLNEVRYAKKGRCMYQNQISDEFARVETRDLNERDVHVLATHKLRTYALFKVEFGMEGYLACVTDVQKRVLLASTFKN